MGDSVTLPKDDAHKIVDVLRKRTGDSVRIIDSAAQEFAASLAIERDEVRVLLDELVASRSSESAREITLAQAIPKGQKLDFVIEKATELGLAGLIPMRSARSVGEAIPEDFSPDHDSLVRG